MSETASAPSGAGYATEQGGASRSSGDEPPAPDQWVMGYYPGYDTTSYPIETIDSSDWSCLTHIAFGPLKVNDDGALNLDFDGKPGHGEKNARAISAAAHDHGVKSLLMLGGAGEGPHLAQATSGTGTIPPLATALLAVVKALGYDGLDLDWEDDIDTAHLLELVKQLRSQQPDILLTYPAKPFYPFEQPDPYLAKLHPYLDRFSVMSYADAPSEIPPGWDSWFSSPLSGYAPTHPMAIDNSLQWWNTVKDPEPPHNPIGVPKDKLMMGIGGFAICYPSGITEPRQSATGRIEGGDNNFPLRKMFASDGPLAQSPAEAQKWDVVAQQPYLSLTTSLSIQSCHGKPTQYIPYDDNDSIIAKGQWSRANGYGGTIVWTLQGIRLTPDAVGPRKPDSLLQALRTGFLA